MVLDQYKSPADAAGFGKKPGDSLSVRCVVQHIHKHAHVEGSGRMRDCDPVERCAFDQTRWPGSEFDSAHAYSGILLRNRAGNGTVTAPDVQHGCTGGNPGGEKIRKNTNASAEYSASVPAFQ